MVLKNEIRERANNILDALKQRNLDTTNLDNEKLEAILLKSEEIYKEK